MMNRPESEANWWSVYHIAAKLKLVGTVNAADAEAAIARVIEEYKVPANQRGRLMAQRRR